MSAGDLPPITSVTGGVAGISATYAAVRLFADRLDRAGDRLRGDAADDARVLLDPDLLESAPLSPLTFAEAEAALGEATSGLHGALEMSVAYEADAVLVRGTLAAIEESDQLVATAFGALDYAAGYEVGRAAPALLVLAAAAVPAWQRLPAATRRRLEGELEEWADEHPALVQHGTQASGGLLDGLLGVPGIHPTASDAGADLARLYPPEGRPVVRARPDLNVPLGRTAPADLRGLIRHLDQTNDLSLPERPDDQGTIEVQTLRGDDGSVRHIVYLPGTDQIGTLPWHAGVDVRDLPADLRIMSGADTTYADGIKQAMKDAGIGRQDPVLLVGHSLGGIEAASMLAHGSGFDVTHVVTAGSPIAGIHDFPAGSHVLSLEARGDVVPLLDGGDNADSVGHVTVQFDDHESSVIGNHDVRHYVHGAAAADASDDPSVREQLASLRRDGFLGGGATATSQVVQIQR
jgi:hypothetical protein